MIERRVPRFFVREIFETESEGFFETWGGAITLLEWGAHATFKPFWIGPGVVALGLHKVGLPLL